MRIDLNVDLGEGYGPFTMDDATALLKIVTSANVAHQMDALQVCAPFAGPSRMRAAPSHPSSPDHGIATAGASARDRFAAPHRC